MDLPAAPPRPLALSAVLAPGQARVVGTVTLEIAGEPFPVEVTLPAGAMRLDALLPVLHGLTNALVDHAAERERHNTGHVVSCRAGCGACCRQAVPVSPCEARALADLVGRFPAARRKAVRARFAAARQSLTNAGVDHRPDTLAAHDRSTRVGFGLAYFGVGVACPFLEAESCSIHEHRPLSCREYAVTSPAAACRSPSPEAIRKLPLAGRVSQTLRALDADREGVGMLVMVDALEWVARHPVPPPGESGPALAQTVFAALAAASEPARPATASESPSGSPNPC